ncbi:MAG: hypothetical protein ACRDV9_01370 [Acidimicrobiia bacterium]
MLLRSVDAASVLWFLAFDVANLSRVAGRRAASMVADCLARARRLGLGGP